MFDRGNAGALSGDRRGHTGIAHRQRRDRNLHRCGQVNAPKHNPGVGLRRTQRQLDPLPAVQTHTDGVGQGLERTLLDHRLILLVCLFAQERRDLEVVHAT